MLKTRSWLIRVFAALLAAVLCAACFIGCAETEKPDNGGQQGQQGGSQNGGGEETPEEDTGEESHCFVRTDKDVYYTGEKIYITAGTDGARVRIAKRGAAEGTAETEYTVAGGTRHVLSDGLAAGEYEAAVYAEGQSAEASASFTVTDQDMQVNKSSYGAGEDIVVTAVGTGTSWVGLYREGEMPGKGTTSICWYYIDQDKHLSGQSYILQRTAKYNRSGFSADQPFPAGEYKVVLFANEAQSSVVKEIPIAIGGQSVGMADAPVSAEYVQDEPGSCRAGGTLTLTFAENSAASEVVAYWADESGALEEYLAFAPQKVSGSVMKFRALDGVAIPERATKLLFFGKNINGEGDECFELTLPELSVPARGEVRSEFNVLSDLHVSTSTAHSGKPDIYNKNFEEACRDIVSVSPASDGMFIVGDITNSGLTAEWAKAKQIMDSVSGVPKAYYAIGNHDLYEVSTPYAEKIRDFLVYAESERVYYEVETGGFHHLILGSQQQQTDKDSPTGNTGVDAILLDDQLEWLDGRLRALSEASSDPVFVYCHQSLYDTIAGSLKGQEWNGVRPEERLRAILAKYPQAILFNGHSHWVMQSYRNAYLASDEMCAAFNTASVGYLWSTTDKEESVSGSQGYYVRVYADEILISGRDFACGAWIPEACYSIAL